jgi:hypothetical protein
MATLKMGSTTVLTDTTLANAVQDNVTRLGTVTAGSIAGGTITNATTFPIGHVLQCQVGTYATATVITTQEELGLEVEITPTSATNNILVTAHINYQHGSASGLKVVLNRSHAPTNETIYTTSTYHVYDSASSQSNGRVSHSVLDDISTGTAWTSGAITYKTYITGYSNNSITIADGGTPCQIIAMEIVA